MCISRSAFLHCPPSGIQAKEGSSFMIVEAEEKEHVDLHPGSHLEVTYVMLLTFQ